MAAHIVMFAGAAASARDGIRIFLQSEGYYVLEANSGEDVLKKMNDSIDLVILDTKLPGITGIQTCEELRKISTVPVMFLASEGTETDKAIGLMVGADDYIVNPFSYMEFVARVNAHVRRYCQYRGKRQKGTGTENQIITSGVFKVAADRNEIWKNGDPVDLTEVEYKIFLLLFRHPMTVFTIDTIYETIWESEYTLKANNIVMVHIRNLRMKLEEDPGHPRYIRNIWGKGYRYEASV